MVSIALGLFQNLMEWLLKGIPGVTQFLMMISVPSQEKFIHRLCSMIQRVQDASLKVKRGKYKLGVPCINFLRFFVDSDGIHLPSDKVRTICNASTPQNMAEVPVPSWPS